MRSLGGRQIEKRDAIKEFGASMRRYEQLSNLLGKLSFYH